MAQIPLVFFASIYGLTAIAGLMLAYAEERVFPEILTPAFAIVAYVLTDHSRKLHLPVIWANALGLAAFGWAGIQMYGSTLDVCLVAGAHLLVYLTWIVLFQDKRLQQYWWMCALAILQVAVGSILTISSSYGGMLIGFMFVAIWTLSVFSLYQAYLQYAESSELTDATAAADLFTRTVSGSQTSRNRPGNSVRDLLMRPAAFRGTMQLDPDERWLGFRYGISMLAVASGALVIAAFFFLFIPRLWAGRSEWSSSEQKQFQAVGMAGFTTEVHLGDLIPLLENSNRVLQVSMFDRDGAALDLERYCEEIGYEEPVFRGVAMEVYEEGTWSESGVRPTFRSIGDGREADSVRQQILMEPLGTPILFAIHPIEGIRLSNTQDLPDVHPLGMQVFRPQNVPVNKPLLYDVFSPPASYFATRRMNARRPGLRRRSNVFSGVRPRFTWQRLRELPQSSSDKSGPLEDYFRQCTHFPEGSLPGLAKLSRTLTGYVPDRPLMSDSDEYDRFLKTVEILNGQLRDSGIYSYSLDTSSRDPKIDPVEDFIVNRKTGHCEYFASALALMLRAVGIPSRIVSGFKGGSVNVLSGNYEVEQRHAHVWVEAYDGLGGWKRVDPTPAAREESVASFASRIGAAHDLASVVSTTWSRLINIDINAQRTAFYTPILNYVRNWWQPVNGQPPLLARIYAGVVMFVTDPTQWFTFTGLVVAIFFGAAITAVVFVVRMRKRIWRRFRTLLARRRSNRGICIAFYVRFENLCRQLGLVRTQGQTQREFAGTVGPRIREAVVSADGLPELPSRLVEFFYRVRFGEEQLSPAVVEEIDHSLTRLETALRKSKRR